MHDKYYITADEARSLADDIWTRTYNSIREAALRGCKSFAYSYKSTKKIPQDLVIDLEIHGFKVDISNFEEWDNDQWGEPIEGTDRETESVTISWR